MANFTRLSGYMHVGPMLLEHGINPAKLIEKRGLPPSLLMDPEAWIPQRAGFQLAEDISEALGDRFAGLHISEPTRFEQHGEWGLRILCAGDLWSAFQQAAQTVRVIDTSIEVGLDVENGSARLWTDYPDYSEIPVQLAEANLLIIKKLVDLAVEPIPMTVRVPHAAPAQSDELERLLGPNLEFGAKRGELVFDPTALELPLQPPPIVSTDQTRQLPPTTPRDTGGAVMRVLRERIEFERPTASMVAHALRMNLRTMQRHLAAWGVTFEDMLAELRHRKAIEYLSTRRHSITEIAFLLGYSDAAHFARAFRRWTGYSPREMMAILENLQSPPATSTTGAFREHAIATASLATIAV